MSLWYNVRTRDPNPTGKFEARRRIGVQPRHLHSQDGWTWQLVTHRTGSTVRRTIYNVAIHDPAGVRKAYLQGFLTARRAEDEALAWIATRGEEPAGR